MRHMLSWCPPCMSCGVTSMGSWAQRRNAFLLAACMQVMEAGSAHQDGQRLRYVVVVLAVQPVAAACDRRGTQHERDHMDPDVLQPRGKGLRDTA